MKRFPDKSRVCFLGDSFVAQNVYVPKIIDYYERNFKDSGIRFFPCGCAGGTAGHEVKWFEKDVLQNEADVAVVMFGINDSERWMIRLAEGQKLVEALDRAYNNYIKNINKLCDLLCEHNVSTILCTPCPYAEFEKDGDVPLKGGYNLISRFADAVRSIAKERGLPLVDYHKFFDEKMKNSEENFFNNDHIHPNKKGYSLMTEYFLASQGLEYSDTDVPEYMSEWLNVLSKYRGIPSVEVMITPWWENMSDEENIAFVGKYVEEKRFRDNFFKRISEAYLVDKPKESELRQQENELYMRDVFGHYKKVKEN